MTSLTLWRFLFIKKYTNLGSESGHLGREVRHRLQVVRRRHPQPGEKCHKTSFPSSLMLRQSKSESVAVTR